MARKAGKPVIMDEFNSVSCGGEPGRSDTVRHRPSFSYLLTKYHSPVQFAAALWTVDYVLGLAASNFTAAYLHTREPGISYDIFTYPNKSGVSNSGWKTGPPYYSLLLLSEAFSNLESPSSNGSVVVDLRLDNPTAVAGYALYNGNALSAAPRALVLFNFDNATSTTTFTLPSGLAPSNDLQTRVRTMTAPTIHEQSSSHIKYAGQTVGGSGKLKGKLKQTIVQCQGGCSVQVPGPGVALVVLQAPISSAARRSVNSGFGVDYGLVGVLIFSLFVGLNV